MLRPFGRNMIDSARTKRRTFELGDGSGGLGPKQLHQLRRYLQRLPRTVPRLSERRASVVLPLCNVDGVASLLFQQRAKALRSYSGDACFPGGMVDRDLDDNVVEAALRELSEELGIRSDGVDVLGVLRCDWSAARAAPRAAPLRAPPPRSPPSHARRCRTRALRSELGAITGVAVTPVVAFIGDLSSDGTLVPPIGGGHHAVSARDVTAGTEVFVKETGDVRPPASQLKDLRRAPESRLRPNPDEVARCFTVPLRLLLDRELWQVTQAAAASYVGAGGDPAPLESSPDGLIGGAPEFMGAPQKIWGLTGYILHRFVADVVGRYRVTDAGQHVPAAFTPGIAVDADDRHEISPRAAAPG